MLKTYLVNMDRNPQRLAFMREQFDRFGIEFERISGIVGANLKGKELRKVFSPVRSLIALRKKMTAGQIGCALSHLAIYHKMIDGNIPAALILEDDCIFKPFLPSQISEVEKFLDPSKPQAFIFNGHGVRIGENTPLEIRTVKNAWCTDCYVCTLAAAKLLVAKNEPVIVVSDAWKRFRWWFGLELYRVVPSACDQAEAESNIQIRKKVNWLVRQLFWVLDFILIKTTGR